MGRLYRDLVRVYSAAARGPRAVLNVLANYADDDGLAWPGRATIAGDAGLSERTVIRCLQKLIADGHIEVAANGNGGRGLIPTYRVLVPERVTSAPEKGDILTQKGDSLTEKGDKYDTERVTSTTSALYMEPDIEPIQEPEREAPAREENSQRHAFFDSRKFINGKVPAGRGATPMEVFHEVHAAHSDGRNMLEPIALREVTIAVTDLALWREVVIAWALSGHKPTNIRGQLDWYGEPSRFRNSSVTVARASPAANGSGRLSPVEKGHEAAERLRARLVAQGKEGILG